MSSDNEQLVVGRVENITLEDGGMVVKGRMDTGAGMSSVNAEIVEIKKAENGKPERVVFILRDGGDGSKKMELDVVEWQNIKVKNGSGYIKRPVVKMDFCLAGKKIEARVNLADRRHFLYPVLVGRNVLKAGDFLIDPSAKFIQDAACR